MFSNRHDAICRDCGIDLNLYGIFIVSEELLDVQMLFHPFEEQLYPPAVSIQKRNQFGGIIYLRSETERYAINIATNEVQEL